MAATRTLDEALSGLENCRMPPALAREAAKAVRENAARAYTELNALIRYGETHGVDVLRLPGSVYGAVGLCQFMPGNIAAYGVDGDDREGVDLFGTADAAHSVGNFLRENGFNPKSSVKKQLEALRRYNRSDSYAALALGMSLQLAGKPVPRELSMFYASGGGKRRAWMPKIRPAYRLPPLGSYSVR
jgi:membrane-bound lytic murein transglycosylase B